MKYIKALDLWEGDTEQRLRDGRLKLQSGQWVYCGQGGVKSRYVGIRGLSIWVAHGFNNKQVVDRYYAMAGSYKDVLNRQTGV